MPDLTATEDRLAAAVAAGDELDLRGAEDRDVRAELVRDLLLAGAGSRGVRLRAGRVVGRLDLEGQRLGPLRLVDCELTGTAWMRGASVPLLDLRGCRLVGLNLTEATVERVLLLSRVRVADGRIDMDGARIGAACSLRSARLRNAGGPALVADRIRLDSELLLDGLVAEGAGEQGAVTLAGARIDGRVSARRLRASNPTGPALVADSMQVTDTVDLSHSSELRGAGDRGALRVVGARASSLSLGGARLDNPTGWALAAHYLDLVGTLYLDRVVATGGLRISGGRVGGQVDLSGATVDGGGLPAVAATRLQVAQGFVLDGTRLSSTGERPTVDLRSVRIAGDLEVRGARLANPAGTALRLNTATVNGRAVLTGLVVERGGVDLRDSTVGMLHDEPATMLPPRDGWVDLNGLTYRGVPGQAGVAVADRLAWLGRMPAYAAQPYRQLAAAYQGAGHPDDARRVLVAQQEHLRRSGALTGWGRLRHRLFGLTLQYGYQPLRAAGALVALLVLAAGLFLCFAGGTAVATDPPAGRAAAEGPCPAVDRVGLAIDTTIPLVDTGAGNRCALATGTPSGRWLAGIGWLISGLGWACATLVVAGYTGLVRRS